MIVLVVVALLLSSCSWIDEIRKEPESKAEPTAWQKVMAMTGPKGEVSKEMALAGFATAYGPVPGGEAPAAKEAGVRSGTPALRWMMAYWDKLTDAQREAVAAITGGQPPKTGAPKPTATKKPTATARPTSSGSKGNAKPQALPAAYPDDSACPANTPYDPALATTLLDWWGKLRQKVGLGDIVPGLGACRSTSRPKNAVADAIGWYNADGVPQCKITVYANLKDESRHYREETYVHELSHCAQALIVADLNAWGQMPSWIGEGLSDWVAGKLTGHYDEPGNWDSYLLGQNGSLVTKAYDAVGFWWELDYSGADIWSGYRGIVLAAVQGGVRNDTEAFAMAVHAVRDTFLRQWPSSFRRKPGLGGGAWDTAGPGLTKTTGVTGQARPLLNGGGPVAGGVDRLTSALEALEIQADVVQFSVGNGGPLFGRFASGEKDFTLPEGLPSVYCTLGAQCVCPPETKGAGTTFQPIDEGRAYFAYTGGANPVGFSAQGMSLEEFCGKPKDKTQPPSPGGSIPTETGPTGPTGPPPACKDCKTASTHGDPHIATFDAAFYDLQSAGEFTLTASLDDGMLVQVRQQPMGKSTSFGVNTAAAASVAGDRVGFHLGPKALEVRVNGKTVTPAAGNTPLPKGGTLARFGAAENPGYAVTWPDGSTLFVTRTSKEALKVDMAVAAGRKGRLNGLLGDNDGNPANDLDAGGGRIVPSSAYEDLHGVFADHWRVKPEKSLFDYAPGESTATFTKRGFPTTRTDLATLPGRAEAEAHCKAAGVTAPGPQFDACVLDVAATGDRAFAESAAAQQKFIAATHPDTGTPQPGDIVDPRCLNNGRGTKLHTANVRIGETVRAPGTGALLCAGYLPPGDWTHNYLFGGNGEQVGVRHLDPAECRLQWTVHKEFVSGTPLFPKTSVCTDLPPLRLEPKTVYILVVDKPAPTVSGRVSFVIK